MEKTTFLLALNKEELLLLGIMLEAYLDGLEEAHFSSLAKEIVAKSQIPVIKSIQNKLKGGNHDGN